MADVTIPKLRKTIAGDQIYAKVAEYDSEGYKISDSLASKQDILTFDGTYDPSTNKVATESTVADAISGLADSVVHGVKLAGAATPITPDASKIVTIPTFSTNAPGLVPSATAGDADKALRGDGTWGDVSSVSVSYDSVNEELHLDFSAGGN